MILLLLLLICVLFFVGPHLVSKYWFPTSIQQYLILDRFKRGQCIGALSFWGVNPKIIIGTKYKKGERFYLLRDVDKYEHLQYIRSSVVESRAVEVICP